MRGREVGIVFKFFQLLPPPLPVAENVTLPMDFCGDLPGRERRPRALAQDGKTVLPVTHERELSHFFFRTIALSDGRVLSDKAAL